MSNKYELTEENVSYIAVAHKSFHIDHETREVIGLDDKDYPRLVDKWLKSGRIVKIESEEKISIETEEADEVADTEVADAEAADTMVADAEVIDAEAVDTEAEEVDMEVEEEDVAAEEETAQPEDSQDPEEESSDHT